MRRGELVRRLVWLELRLVGPMLTAVRKGLQTRLRQAKIVSL